MVSTFQTSLDLAASDWQTMERWKTDGLPPGLTWRGLPPSRTTWTLVLEDVQTGSEPCSLYKEASERVNLLVMTHDPDFRTSVSKRNENSVFLNKLSLRDVILLSVSVYLSEQADLDPDDEFARLPVVV